MSRPDCIFLYVRRGEEPWLDQPSSLDSWEEVKESAPRHFSRHGSVYLDTVCESHAIAIAQRRPK